jgi:hypothetical protein
MEEVPGSEKFFPAQLVFLALGFLGPQSEVLNVLGIQQDVRSNIQTPPKVRVVTSYFWILKLSGRHRNIRPTSRVYLQQVTVAVVSH